MLRAASGSLSNNNKQVIPTEGDGNDNETKLIPTSYGDVEERKYSSKGDEETSSDEEEQLALERCVTIKKNIQIAQNYLDNLLPFQTTRGYLKDKIITNPPLLLWLENEKIKRNYGKIEPTLVSFLTIAVSRDIVIAFAGMNKDPQAAKNIYLWYNVMAPVVASAILTMDLMAKNRRKDWPFLSYPAEMIRNLSVLASMMTFIFNMVGMNTELIEGIEDNDKYQNVYIPDWGGELTVGLTCGLGGIALLAHMGLFQKLKKSEYFAGCSYMCASITRGIFTGVDIFVSFLRNVIKTNSFMDLIYTSAIAILSAIFGQLFNLGPIEYFAGIVVPILCIAILSSGILAFQDFYKDRKDSVAMLRTTLAAITVAVMTCETLYNMWAEQGLIIAQIPAMIMQFLIPMALYASVACFSSEDKQLAETDRLIKGSSRTYSSSEDSSSTEEIQVGPANYSGSINSDGNEAEGISTESTCCSIVKETIFCFSKDNVVAMFSQNNYKRQTYIQSQDRFSELNNDEEAITTVNDDDLEDKTPCCGLLQRFTAK